MVYSFLNGALRQELDLTLVRPVRYFEGVASPLKGEKQILLSSVKILEDIYAGDWNGKHRNADGQRRIEFLQTEMNVNKIRFPES